METQTGQFVAGAKPLGTVTERMVIERAREIAVINGRTGPEYTPDDLIQARLELTGSQTAEPGSLDEAAPAGASWLGEPGDRGHRAPVRPASDEQTFAENLVQQGVAEATHDSMLAGARQSAEQD